MNAQGVCPLENCFKPANIQASPFKHARFKVGCFSQGKVTYIQDDNYTEMRFNLCTWLAEISSCSCLTVLPGPAWVLLNKICKDYISSLYISGFCYLAVSCRDGKGCEVLDIGLMSPVAAERAVDLQERARWRAA